MPGRAGLVVVVAAAGVVLIFFLVGGGPRGWLSHGDCAGPEVRPAALRPREGLAAAATVTACFRPGLTRTVNAVRTVAAPAPVVAARVLRLPSLMPGSADHDGKARESENYRVRVRVSA